MRALTLFATLLLSAVSWAGTEPPMFAITGPPEPVGGGPDFSGPASVQYQVLLNFDAIASDQSLRMTLPGFNEEVVAVREMKDLECCFLPGFTVMPDPDAPPQDFIYKWIGRWGLLFFPTRRCAELSLSGLVAGYS